MSRMLIGSIDLNKIDKSKIVTKDKDGNPFKNGAKYINITVWVNDEIDQYGNNASIQIGGKEDKVYIGNLKDYVKEGAAAPVNSSSTEDDLPF